MKGAEGLRRAGAGTEQAETGRREGQTLGGPREFAERAGAGAGGPLGAASSRRPVPRRPPPSAAPTPSIQSASRHCPQPTRDVLRTRISSKRL